MQRAALNLPRDCGVRALNRAPRGFSLTPPDLLSRVNGERLMPFLIDGNNLLFAAREAEGPDRPPGRSLLCARLGDWARRTGAQVHVVFDGPAPDAPFAKQIGDPDIQVSFSGRGVTADAALIAALASDSAARRLVVVSTDREIRAAARRRRARVLRSDEFWARLQRDLARPETPPREPPEKRHGLTPGEGAAWLRELGLGDSGGLPPDDGTEIGEIRDG